MAPKLTRQREVFGERSATCRAVYIEGSGARISRLPDLERVLPAPTMCSGSPIRFTLAGLLGIVLSLVACTSEPASSEPDDETAESALNGCGYHIGNGPLIGRAANACVPGTTSTTSAGCALPN